MEVRIVTKTDWSRVREIYQLGIDTGVATFETSPPVEFQTWINKIDKGNGFVCIKNEELLGWATLSKVSSRCAYEGVGEVSIYVDPKYQKQLVGETLYETLERSALKTGYWTLQAQLFTQNVASKAFFEKHGFREVGIRKKIGQLNGEWVDNYLFEKNFN
jgi:phosphinothricin acetyltransferase